MTRGNNIILPAGGNSSLTFTQKDFDLIAALDVDDNKKGLRSKKEQIREKYIKHILARKQNLSREWIELNLDKGCAVTKLPFLYISDSRHPRRPELDRIIPGADDGDYTEDNCRFVCRAINQIKGARISDKEIVNFIFDAVGSLSKFRW